jgi:methionine synthase II (cobalamin-independent)
MAVSKSNFKTFSRIPGTWTALVIRAENAIRLFRPERVLLTPDCGFATFADNPISSATVAEAKLSVIAEAARILRQSSDS